MYDVTDRNSFNSIRNWVEEIDKNADKHVNKILIGNKCDVEDRVSVHAVVRLRMAAGQPSPGTRHAAPASRYPGTDLPDRIAVRGIPAFCVVRLCPRRRPRVWRASTA